MISTDAALRCLSRRSTTDRDRRFTVALILNAAVLACGATAARGDQIAEARRVDLSHRLRFTAAPGFDGQFQEAAVTWEPQLDVSFSDALRFTSIARLRADAADLLEPGVPAEPEVSPITQRGFIGAHGTLELREAWFEAAIADAVAKVGKQQIVWGQADGLKVLDVVNPQNFRAFILEDFTDSRVPLWSFQLSLPVESFDLDVVWVVDQTYHILPEAGARYAFTSPLLVPSPPAGTPVRIDPPNRPGRVIADSDAGLRLSTFWNGWDLTFNYLYHHHDFPAFARRPGLVGGVPGLIVTPEYGRTHLVGGTFSNAFGALTVRGEVGVFFDKPFSTDGITTPGGVTRGDEISYVVGLDWFGLAETLISAQIFQSWVPDTSAGLLRDSVETLFTLLLRRELVNDTLVLEAMWLTDLKRGDGLVRPKVSHALNDHLDVWVGLDLFYGGGGSLFGQFGDNSRAVMGLDWSF